MKWKRICNESTEKMQYVVLRRINHRPEWGQDYVFDTYEQAAAYIAFLLTRAKNEYIDDEGKRYSRSEMYNYVVEHEGYWDSKQEYTIREVKNGGSMFLNGIKRDETHN